ncbi:MAG TPA: glycosyltransferase 87 family protein [Solirubrobacteraceae bacterium]|nr:glycosyltransferase 87 family protein [Solirubrobacteraceae bacterium]
MSDLALHSRDVARPRGIVAAGALALMLALALALAIAGAGGTPFLVRVPPSAFPGWLAGPFGGLGGRISEPAIAGLLVAFAACAYAATFTVDALPARVVLAAIVTLNAIFLLAPPLLSADIFGYVTFGRLGALHGLDPYTHAAVAAPGDAAYRFVGWHHSLSPYGPLFTVLTYGLVLLGVAGSMWALKAVAFASSLGIVAIVWRLAERSGHDPRRAAAVVGLNPVLLVYAVGGGHNDLLMLLVMTSAVALVISGRDGAGGAAAVAAVGLKLSAVVLLPFVVLGARSRARALGGAALAALGVALVAVLAFGTHATGFAEVVSAQQRYVSHFSVPDGIRDVLGLHSFAPWLRASLQVAFLVALVVLVVRVWRGADWVAGAGWALLALTVTSSWLMVWYTTWPLPFAAISRSRPLLAAAIALQVFLLAQVAVVSLLHA